MRKPSSWFGFPKSYFNDKGDTCQLENLLRDGEYLRLAYALDDESLRQACSLIEKFTNQLR